MHLHTHTHTHTHAHTVTRVGRCRLNQAESKLLMCIWLNIATSGCEHPAGLTFDGNTGTGSLGSWKGADTGGWSDLPQAESRKSSEGGCTVLSIL